MANKKEEQFYRALEDIFVGAKIEGEGGFVNLLKMKSEYYKTILVKFRADVAAKNSVITSSFKEEFYELLYSFFVKYFSESGSVYFTKTASWQKVYEKVYTDTKDVALFWKTHMLYYVKSDILFQSLDVYVPVSEDEDADKKHFFFDVGALQNKQNNTKKDLVYTFEKFEKDAASGKYTFKVAYSANGSKTKIDDIKRAVRSVGAPLLSEEIILKAIKIFEKQSSVDFFINKNAKEFLTEQLDLYLHQIMLDTANQFDQTRLNQLKTIKEFAVKVIDFIAQFENELVCVWNKPKFVLNSNYVITLDRINETIVKKIEKAPGLAEQIKEWQMLNMVDNAFDFAKRNATHKYLPIDTKFFKELELEILAQFDNLDEALDGRLIHSENYQALNTLQNRYKEKVQCIYIDPPFNTGNDFLFLDKYQDASWLNIMQDRLLVSKSFLKSDGSLYLHLDHIMEHYGKILLDEIIGAENFKSKVTWNTGDNISGFKAQALNWIRQADYIHLYGKSKNSKFIKCHEPLVAGQKIGWLDILGNTKEHYIEVWENGVLVKKPVDIKSKPKGTIWNDIYSFMYSEPRETESLSFNSNQKPENLLRRIIQSTTDKQDIVADYFAGSGTTPAVAHKLNRKYLACDMGEYFGNTYLSQEEVKNEQVANIIFESVIEKKNSTIVGIVRKVGLLGRMKLVLNGDKKFYPTHSKLSREPHLSKDINWQGGGFFKYFALEQYEDTLRQMSYRDNTPTDIFNTQKPYAGYIFLADEKLIDKVVTNDDIDTLDFDKLYKGIDLPETISHLLGLPIKRITKTEVILDGSSKEIIINYDYKTMSKEDKVKFLKMLQPYIWWRQ